MYDPTPIEYLRHRFANMLRDNNAGRSITIHFPDVDHFDALDALADLMLYRGIRWNHAILESQHCLTIVGIDRS